MALTKTQVSQLYVSIFGRASEGSGNAYWQTSLASTDMVTTADTMLGTQAAQTYFGSTLDTNQAFIEYIYLNTLGKTYTQDSSGIDFWVAQLDGGKSKGQVVATLIEAAQEMSNAGAAQDQFNNRVEVSDYTADKISDYTDRTTFSGFIDSVTDDKATVTLAKAKIDQGDDPQDTIYTITLTKEKDIIVGSAEDDQILGLDDTYNAVDSIDGGGGIDTLSLLFFAPETDRVTVSQVENVIVRNAQGSTNLDGSGWNGVDTLTITNSTSPTQVSGVQEKLALVVEANNQNVSLAYAQDVLKSDVATQTLLVTDSTAGISIITSGSDAITDLQILSSGTNVISLAENDLKTLTITGSGDLQLSSLALDMDKLIRVSTILAAGVTGDLILDLSAIDLSLTGETVVSISTGTGNDTIQVSGNANTVDAGGGDDYVLISSGLDVMDKLAGGSGTDILAMTSEVFVATVTATEVLAGITGFEAIGLIDEFDLGTAIDIRAYGVNSLVIEAGLNGDEEVTGFLDNATIEIRTDKAETDVLTITMPGATDAGSNLDKLNIVFKADLEADEDLHSAALDIKGINYISVLTADFTTSGETTDAGTLPDSSDGYGLVLLNDGNISTIEVGGTQAFHFSSSTTSTVQTILSDKMSGDMVLDFITAFGGTQGVSITSGNGNDTITGSEYGDIIDTGAGNDLINLTTGTDKITGGAGSDTFIIGEADISIETAYSSILDFSTSSDSAIADKITNIASTITDDIAGVDVAAAEASGGVLGGVSMEITADIAQGMITVNGDDAAQINTMSEWLAVFYLACDSTKTAGFEFAGNTYLVEESSASSGVGSMVELVGVGSITTLAATGGDHTIIISV